MGEGTAGTTGLVMHREGVTIYKDPRDIEYQDLQDLIEHQDLAEEVEAGVEGSPFSMVMEGLCLAGNTIYKYLR